MTPARGQKVCSASRLTEIHGSSSAATIRLRCCCFGGLLITQPSSDLSSPRFARSSTTLSFFAMFLAYTVPEIDGLIPLGPNEPAKCSGRSRKLECREPP